MDEPFTREVGEFHNKMSSRARDLLNRLRVQLTPWIDTICKATSATDLTFSVHPEGLSVHAKWKNADGTEGQTSKVFAVDYVLGPDHSSTFRCRIQKRTCEYAREVIRQVLTARGVI